MRKPGPIFALIVLVFVTVLAARLRADDKKTLIVTAMTRESHVNERTTYYTTPGKSTTDCTDTVTGMNCDTTTTPPRTNSITTRTTDVTEKVIDQDNMVYTIVCTAHWRGSNCEPLIDGDRFEVEIDGTTMWVHGRKGGNRGKSVKAKYKILNIRKQTPPASGSNDECRGDERDTSEVWRLGRDLRYTDAEVTEAIRVHGVCRVLVYLRGEASRKAQPVTSAPPTDTYAGVGGGHWISENSNNGAIITLEDGSLWEVSALDRMDTALWLPTTNITVLESRPPVSDYKYILINKDDGEKALVKYLGRE